MAVSVVDFRLALVCPEHVANSATGATTSTLWSHAESVIGPNSIAENRIGDELLHRGEPEAAMQHFKRAVAIQPTDADSNFAIAVYEQKTTQSKRGDPALQDRAGPQCERRHEDPRAHLYELCVSRSGRCRAAAGMSGRGAGVKAVTWSTCRRTAGTSTPLRSAREQSRSIANKRISTARSANDD